MRDVTLYEKIELYIDGGVQESYLGSLLDSTTTEILFNDLTDLMQSRQRTQINSASFLVRELMLLAPREASQHFRDQFYSSTVATELNKNVFASDHFVRCDAVYTIGKVGLSSGIDTLSRAFQHYLDTDPLLLDMLLDELTWLGAPHHWDRIDHMVRSSSYLTRWSTLSLSSLDHFLSPRNAQEAEIAARQAYYLDLLKSDSHVLPKQEAQFRSLEFLFAQTVESFLSKADRRRERKALNLQQPRVTFDDVKRSFYNYMHKTEITTKSCVAPGMHA